MIVVFILSALCWRKIRGLWKFPDGRDRLRGKRSCSEGKSLIQFSVDGQGCVPSLLFDLRPKYGNGNNMRFHKVRYPSFKRSPGGIAALNAPDPVAGHHRPMPLPETPGHSWASLGQSLVVSLLLSPGSWHAQDFVCTL